MDASYAEIIDWASEMDRIRGVLQLARTAFPAPLTLWRSFNRVSTLVRRQLLDRSATACDPGEHGALDATFFDRQAASSHYINRSDRHIQTLKTTALSILTRVPSPTSAVRHTGPTTHGGPSGSAAQHQRNKSLVGDKGYDDQSLRNTFRSEGVRPLIKHRLFAAYDHAHNARVDTDPHGQRWMAETAFSAIKRRYGSAVGPSSYYRQFRELVVTAVVYNLEQAIRE